MNSPPMRPEQLSPQLSPMAFSLDDSKNAASSGANSFQHLLASPTKFKLDSCNGESSANSHIYRTSLSKLSELSRTGRSRQRSNSDTLRSVSPIRFQLFKNAPKMLRQEYISPQPTASPLLSTLIRQSVTQSTGNSVSNNKREDTYKAGVRETLEQIQREQRELLQRQESRKKEAYIQQKPKLTDQDTTYLSKSTTEIRKVSQTDSQVSGTTVCESNIIEDSSKDKTILSNMNELPDSRIISSSSTISSTYTVDLNDISKEMDIELLSSDKVAFVSFEEPKSNRYSFISSSSTDYDGGEWSGNQTDLRNSHSDETAKLDFRIKQLEIEIGNLKVQNEKLIQSLTTTRTVEDKFMLEALWESRSSKQKAQQGMEKKVKQLERRVESYKKAMKSSEDGQLESSITIDSGIPDYKANTIKRRITRISSGELRKIDEQSDTSRSSSDDEKDEQIHRHDNYKEGTLTRELAQHEHSDQSTLRKKQGLRLNIQMEKTME